MKKHTKNVIFIAIMLLGVLFQSCSKSEDDKTATNEKPQLSEDVLKTQLDSLKKNMELQWDTMVYYDDLKMQYLARFIDELSFIPGNDALKVDSLKSFYQEVKNIKLERYEMKSETIDLFDEQQTKLIEDVISVAKKTPNIGSYPLVNELISDIKTLDLQLISDRGIYDEYSIPYNKLLLYQTEGLAKLPSEYQNLKMATVFMIEPNYEDKEPEVMEVIQ